MSTGIANSACPPHPTTAAPPQENAVLNTMNLKIGSTETELTRHLRRPLLIMITRILVARHHPRTMTPITTAIAEQGKVAAELLGHPGQVVGGLVGLQSAVAGNGIQVQGMNLLERQGIIGIRIILQSQAFSWPYFYVLYFVYLL